MYKSLFYCICFLMLSVSLKANQNNNAVAKSFGLKTGLYRLSSVDQLYSPFIYAGESPFYGITYGSEKPNKSNETSLSFSNIQRNVASLEGLPNSYEPGHYLLGKNSFVFEAMDYYRFLLNPETTNYFQLYFSGLWFSTVNITSNAMGLPELIQTGIAPGIKVRKKAGNHMFKAELNTPIFALTVRNNYSMSMAQTYEKLSKLAFIKQNLLFQSPFSNRAIFTDLTYSYTIAQRVNIAANYHFRYQHNTKPVSLYSVAGIYSISTTYNF